MGAIDKLAKKLGFVRLDRYGLVHTPDDRILSTRPTVLDDGVGGKIVGWLDSDLAAAELERWGAPKEAPRKKIEFPKAAQVIAPMAAPVPAPAPAPAPGPKPVAAAPKPLPGVAPMVVAAPAPAPVPVQVAPEPPVEEDEWEWEIAVARARAEAAPAAAPLPKPEPVRTPKVTQQPLPRLFATTTAPGTTVIPVPALPVATDPSKVRPVAVGTSPKRFPKATGRHEDTIVTKAAPPANDDTQPSISLPRAASTVGLPSAKRVAAKQR